MNFENQVFQSQTFSKKSLENHIYSSCNFKGCDFSEVILRNAQFICCIFTNCNLSLPKLESCRFQDVQFIECKILGAEFFKCEKMLFLPKFENCFLHYCNFADLNMKKVSFKGSKIRECYFTETNLKSANFDETELPGTLFHKCDLSFADFSTASQYDIDPLTNNLKKAKFSLPEVVGLIRGFGITIV